MSQLFNQIVEKVEGNSEDILYLYPIIHPFLYQLRNLRCFFGFLSQRREGKLKNKNKF